MRQFLENVHKSLHYHALIIWRTKAFWVRALLCWMFGALLLVNDETANYDLRLKTRGARPAASPIVLIDLNERDLEMLLDDGRNVLRPLKEVLTYNDAYFWNTGLWNRLLRNVLDQEPAAVGVTFHFGENVRMPEVPEILRPLFEHPRIIWGADVDSADRFRIPMFASTYNSNVGLRGLRADDDGTVRRFSTSIVHLPHMSVRLAEVAKPGLASWVATTFQAPTLINYTGGKESFETISAKDLLEGRVSGEKLRGKIAIIGNLGSSAEMMQTPLGRMSRAEVVANIVDNVLAKRTVRRLPMGAYFIMLALLMAGSIWILATYPQSVTLVLFVVAAVVWASMSAAAFDILHVWVPVLTPLVQLTLTCIVFLSYQLALNERRTWRLQQEQRYLTEIEQLKTNFVSMMSHDLKTPIAKIQAICDRLIASVAEPEIAQDLKSLRRSSDELHRYIQSILQVTKVEAKDFKIRKEVTDINENVERVVGRLQPLAAEKGIAIATDLEPMFSIEVDTTLIQEVIHNLIENAVKYTPPGGRVTVTSKEMDDNVVVVIEDTGPGIEPEDQEEIWRKFSRGRRPNMEIKGTGLGLYLVKYFVELHGGRVFLESEVGRGTKIGFSIPLAASEVGNDVVDVGIGQTGTG